MEEQEIVTRSIRLPASVADALDKLASNDRRSFSNYVSIVLDKHVATADATKPAEVSQPAQA